MDFLAVLIIGGGCQQVHGVQRSSSSVLICCEMFCFGDW